MTLFDHGEVRPRFPDLLNRHVRFRGPRNSESFAGPVNDGLPVGNDTVERFGIYRALQSSICKGRGGFRLGYGVSA